MPAQATPPDPSELELQPVVGRLLCGCWELSSALYVLTCCFISPPHLLVVVVDGDSGGLPFEIFCGCLSLVVGKPHFSHRVGAERGGSGLSSLLFGTPGSKFANSAAA